MLAAEDTKQDSAQPLPPAAGGCWGAGRGFKQILHEAVTRAGSQETPWKNLRVIGPVGVVRDTVWGTRGPPCGCTRGRGAGAGEELPLPPCTRHSVARLPSARTPPPGVVFFQNPDAGAARGEHGPPASEGRAHGTGRGSGGARGEAAPNGTCRPGGTQAHGEATEGRRSRGLRRPLPRQPRGADNRGRVRSREAPLPALLLCESTALLR